MSASNQDVIIAKAVGAATGSREITRGSLPMTLCVDGTLVAEVITIKYVGADGLVANATTAAKDGANVELSVTNTAVGIFAPCWIYVSKPITANAVGVVLRG